tara:strand:+ start:341 stop:655 length:315 start_codon:yes stop_codon:yes gene_type:complete
MPVIFRKSADDSYFRIPQDKGQVMRLDVLADVGAFLKFGDVNEFGDFTSETTIDITADQLWSLFRLMQDWKRDGADVERDFHANREVKSFEDEFTLDKEYRDRG